MIQIDVPCERARLEGMTVGQLAKVYEEVVGEPARSRHKGYLIRRIVWRLQARGLTWADGDEVASQAARTTRPIVFVGDRLPPTGVWPGRVPPVIALSQFATLGENGLVVDHDAVLAAILEVDTIGSSTPQSPFKGDQLALMGPPADQSRGNDSASPRIAARSRSDQSNVGRCDRIGSELLPFGTATTVP